MFKKCVLVTVLSLLAALGFGLNKSATIVVMAPQDQIWDSERALADNFTKETGIKVDFQIYPSDQWANLLQTKLNSGECGDIFVDQSGALNIGPRYNIEKNGTDLSAEPWVKTIDPTLLSAVTLKGKVYGLELWDVYNVWGYVYSKPTFQKLGLAVPKTFDQLIAVLKKLKAAGVVPIYEPAADGWHHQLPLLEMGGRLNQLHPGLYDQLNNNKVKLADVPELLKLLDQIVQVSKYFGDNYLSDQYANTSTVMASGKAAISLRTSTFPAEIVTEAKDLGAKAEDYGVFVMPYLDNQSFNVNPQGPTHFVYSKGKNVAEAKAFLAYLAKKENAQFFLDGVPRFERLPILGLKYKQSASAQELAANTKGGSVIVMQAAVKYIDPQWMDIGKDLTSVLTGQMTPKQLLQNMDKRRMEQAIAQKDPAWVK